jgi:hypothetical protein
MLDDQQLWNLIGEIEARLPLQRGTLEAFLGTRFGSSRDHNGQPILVATTSQYEIVLRPAREGYGGNVSIAFTPPAKVAMSSVYQRFPGGHSLPPPPPGYGSPDAAGAYIANRSWGQIWFTFFTGDRLMNIMFGPGMRSSPGV